MTTAAFSTAALTTAAFWTAALAMVALGWALLCLPWPRREMRRSMAAETTAQGADRERASANAVLLGEQLQALRAEFAAGRIDEAAHQAAALEIQRRLLQEADGAAPEGGAVPINTRAPLASISPQRPFRSSRQPSSSGSLPSLPLVLAFALPAIAAGGYALLGNPAGLAPAPAAAVTAEPEVSKDDVAAMVDTLATRLEGRPSAGLEDLQGWVMLGRSYAALQRFDAAARAYGRALALTPDDPQLLADRADMLAMQQGQRLGGEPARLIERALALDPKQLKALALAGSAAFERREWAAAADYWRRARALVADGSDLAQGLDRSLAEVAAADGQAPAAVTSSATGRGAPANPEATNRDLAAGPGGAIDGTVRLAPALAGKVSPDDTVFVFARAAQGPRMPLAIVRRRAADLPLDFRLDDSQAMSPALKLSGYSQVVVGVRVSRSGQAMPQPGDLIGEAPAAPGGAPVRITIDRIQP